MPVGYLVMLAAVTMMIVTILFSIAQIYQTTNSIANLERELSALQTTASELELAIEEKNDIRTIEQIATDQLGMVKEDSVQRKYISLSDGERIDIIGEEETISDSGFGTMLSSIASALAGFFENLGR
jgi:cell division protein FtsL